MTPDDPRHGTYAGAQAHDKTRDPLCEPCRQAKGRYVKHLRYRLREQGPTRGPLGNPAWNIIDSLGRRELSRLTGLRDSYLSRLHGAGPNVHVYRSTRTKILAARPPATALGIQRRLRALHALGYSGARIAAEVGVTVDAMRATLRSPTPLKYHHERVTLAVVDVYDRLSLQPMPTGREATAARRRAVRNGWAPPLAWDDIDDPNATPHTTTAQPAGRPMVRDQIIEDAEWLADADETLTTTLTRLNLTPEAFYQTCRRANRLDLYAKLSQREPATGEMARVMRATKRKDAA